MALRKGGHRSFLIRKRVHAPPRSFDLPGQRHRDVAIGQVVNMLGKEPRHELRGAVGPARPDILDPSAERALEVGRQRAEEVVEELTHFAAHPFARQVLLACQSEDERRARRRAADGENASRLIEADRPLAAQDAKQCLAVHPSLAGDLVPRLVGMVDGMGESSRDGIVRMCGHRGRLMHGGSLD